MWEIDLLGTGTVYRGDEVIAGRVCKIRPLDVSDIGRTTSDTSVKHWDMSLVFDGSL